MIASVLFLWCWNYGLNLLEKQILSASWVVTERFFCFSRKPPLQCLTKIFGRVEIDRETLSVKRKVCGVDECERLPDLGGFCFRGIQARLAGETAF